MPVQPVTYIPVVNAMISEVRAYPQVQAWMAEQARKIAEAQVGTWRERRNKDGDPIPKWPFGGPGECFEYITHSGGLITSLRIRCVLTGDELDLTPEDGW